MPFGASLTGLTQHTSIYAMMWLQRTDLEQWADRVGAREQFPVIIRDLILASARDLAEIRHIRFPGGESSQLPGYDGDLTMAVGSTYVPAGRSVWEFGVNANPAVKFDSDYKKRAIQGTIAERAEMTFVFVTPRAWVKPRKKLPDWLKEYKDKKDFKDVLYVDGVQLEGWLERHGAVGAKHARAVLGYVPQRGIRSTGEFWDEFSARYRPRLTERVALCARAEQATQIVAHLKSSNGSLVLVGDGPDEVTAVTVAAIRSAPDSDRAFLEARTLVVETDEAGREVSVANRYGYILAPTVRTVAGSLANYGPAVSTVSFRPSGGGVARLERPSTRDMGEALTTMGFGEEKAETLARKSGRSITILERHAHAAGPGRASWADGGGESLVPALLAGAWSARHEGDRAVLATLSGLGYDEFEARIRPFLARHDAPLDQESGVWKLRAPVDAFLNLSHLVGGAHLERLAAASISVFATADSPNTAAERLGVATAPYSSFLRDGIATTLLVLAAIHEEVGLGAIADPEAFVRKIVESLPGLNSDMRMILGLEGQLIYLMEAVPDPLLEALEHVLEGEAEDPAPYVALATGNNEARPRLPNLLWALEMLAWDPVYLSRVTMVLATLASRDTGGRTSNRPIDSLRDIFVAWSPGTNASLAERMAAVDEVLDRDPDTGWQLLVVLLPTLRGFKSATPRPRFREAGASEREPLTVRAVAEAFDAVIDRALLRVGSVPGRWRQIAEAFPQFSLDRRLQFLEMLGSSIASIEGSERDETRRALRRIADRHARFPDADWALPAAELDALNQIVAALEGGDPIGRARALFDDAMPFLPDNYPAADRALAQRRRDAVSGVAKTDGTAAVLRLAASVRMPRLVAVAAAEAITEERAFDEMLGSSAPDEAATEFEIALAAGLRARRGSDYDGHVAGLAQRLGWGPLRTATTLLDWPEEPATWRFLGSLGEEVARLFWSRKQPRLFDGSAADLNTLVGHYAAVGRAGAALMAVHGRESELEWAMVERLLDGRLLEFGGRGSHDVMDGYYVAELFKSLRARGDVPRHEFAQWEYVYFELLEHGDQDLLLFDYLATDPAFFVAVLRDVYREDGADTGVEGTSDPERNRAAASYRILVAFKRVPGETHGAIDEMAMTAWVDGVLQEGAKAKRSKVAASYVGRVLARAAAEDGVWPPTAVARTIERLKSREVEEGMLIERINMRGVYSKALFEGGQQERDLAKIARAGAKARAAFPRTKAMLGLIAKNWEADAKRADEQAAQDRLRYE